MTLQKKEKTLDYLFEDPPLQSQKFALVTIVGPNMPQKCDVWGVKVRGVAGSIEEAKRLSQKILRIDNNYDIYTVDIGKFFPLVVNPLEINNVEYQNEQLNTLIKNYLENRETANDFWHKRKSDMIQEAIKEGKNQEELSNKPEHPIAVLQRIQNYEKTILEIQDNLENFKRDLQSSKAKFESYSEEDRKIAQNELKNAIDNNLESLTVENKETEISVEEIRAQLLDDFNLQSNETTTDDQNDININLVLNKIKNLEQELEEMISFKNSIIKESAPSAYKRVEQNIKEIETELSNLKTQLNNKQVINDYINENYENPQIFIE
jgi:hypothetical protein|uniref:Uncharacterized protein n=1 Tax=viral metagenome TaxID=1070528 RepID=A0A6C0ALW5_9ZZZZ